MTPAERAEAQGCERETGTVSGVDSGRQLGRTYLAEVGSVPASTCVVPACRRRRWVRAWGWLGRRGVVRWLIGAIAGAPGGPR